MEERAEESPVEISYRRLGRVLASTGSEYDVEGVLNPAVCRDRQRRLLVYPRIVAAGNVSRIGLVAADECAGEPIFGETSILFDPTMDYELRDEPGGYGCEDPRVTFLAELDLYAMAYTAFGPRGPRIALAISSDAYAWERLGPVRFGDEPLNHRPNKDAAFFPEPVLSPAGIRSFAFYHRPMLHESWNGQAPIALIQSLPFDEREATCIAYVPVDEVRRDIGALRFAAESVRVLPVGDDWGRLKNGAGTPPVRTQAGWLSFFHGVDAVTNATGASLLYRAGVVIHDVLRPDRIVYRSPVPFLRPETLDEKLGVVNDVVFPTGLDPRGDLNYDVYYGAADAKIARARVDVRLAL